MNRLSTWLYLDKLLCTHVADLEQVKLSSRCSGTDEEVFGKQKTLSLSFLPQ